jgi:hypothetical protein
LRGAAHSTAVVLDEQSATCIYCCGKPDTPNYGAEDRVIDIKEKYEQTGKEGEGRQRLNNRRNVHVLSTPS